MANLNKKVDALIKNKEKNATLKIGLKKLLEKVLYFSETASYNKAVMRHNNVEVFL